MSYCMYQNTKRALQQILNDLDEAHEEGVTYLEYIDDLSLEEKYAMKELDNIFEGIQDILKEMRRSKAND